MGKTGKIILAIVVVLLIAGGVYAGWNIANSNNEQTAKLTDNEMYETVINNYKNAINEYNIEDLDSEENINNKYDLVSLSLIQHVARYQKEGVKLTYSFYDIDKNGIKELIVGASGAAGAIYTYNSESKKPEKIFYQDTLERGTLSIYDNGVILSEGSGGAALHVFEFGKISQDGTSYQLLENIEEEYKDENSNPEYRDGKTNQTLNYKNLDEIKSKYLSDSEVVTITDNKDM